MSLELYYHEKNSIMCLRLTFLERPHKKCGSPEWWYFRVWVSKRSRDTLLAKTLVSNDLGLAQIEACLCFNFIFDNYFTDINDSQWQPYLILVMTISLLNLLIICLNWFDNPILAIMVQNLVAGLNSTWATQVVRRGKLVPRSDSPARRSSYPAYLIAITLK